ncbi:MAG: hypothetical protein BWY31_03110 [Lentisphaerae bacterium ADurb.Bin242]|nr:MAG: hypothetical protein BWY31_03110 [Lentisphaerae bacterium ADurb.Bin242]
MNSKMFWVFFCLIFLGSAAVSEEVMLLQKGAPLYRFQENLNLAYTVEKEMSAVVLKKEKMNVAFLDYLVVETPIWRVLIPQMGELFWTFPEVESVVRGGDSRAYTFRFARLPVPMFLGVIFLFLCLLSLFIFFRDKTFRFRKYLMPLSILFFHFGICLYVIGYSGGVLIKPSDEVWYFEIAKKILAFDFTKSFNYTIGHSVIFYIPILLFTGIAATYQEVSYLAPSINCFLVAPVCLLFVYMVLKKLFRSETLPAWSLFLWYGFILLYHQRLYSVKLYVAETYVQKSVPSFPALGFSPSLFEIYIACGWNGMSDALCMLFLFLTLFCAISLKPSTRNMIIVSALFATTCLIRINSILYAPLLGFILYLNYADLLKIPGTRLRLIFYGAFAFLTVFSFQLAVNLHHFGSPFTMPYVLHTSNDAVKGFVLKLVPYGLYFLSASNHAVFVLGTLSLFFIPDRKTRAILALWIYPVLFFFTGYPVVYNNYSRFILPVYPAFMAAIFLNCVWKQRLSVVFRSLGILLAGVLLTAPGDAPAVRRYLPWGLERYGVSPETMDMVRWIVIALSVVVLATFVKDFLQARKKGRPLREILPVPLFLGLFLIVFYAGNYWITGAAMLCAFLYGLYDAVLLCLEALRKPRVPEPRPEDRAFP